MGPAWEAGIVRNVREKVEMSSQEKEDKVQRESSPGKVQRESRPNSAQPRGSHEKTTKALREMTSSPPGPFRVAAERTCSLGGMAIKMHL